MSFIWNQDDRNKQSHRGNTFCFNSELHLNLLSAFLYTVMVHVGLSSVNDRITPLVSKSQNVKVSIQQVKQNKNVAYKSVIMILKYLHKN